MQQQERTDPVEPIPSIGTVAVSVRDRVGAALGFQRREAVALAVLGVLVLVGASVAYVRARPASATALSPIATTAPVAAEVAGTGARVVVHVAGAVRKPGVYEFTEGARVVDAVEAAGGFAKKADTAAVNLARVLTDGEQILIPRVGEVSSSAGGGGGGAAGGKVNINTATAAELEALPGIGPVLAQRIVDHRTQNGPFGSGQDLLKVSGIGPKIFASLEPLITV